MTDYTHNPFASTHSLDTNPFDDPVTPTQHQSQPSPAEANRLDEIRRREADLERRERELNAKAENIRHHGKANWPPFFPLIFHSIKDEIPEASQPLITRLYQLWLVLLLTLIINMVACIFILLAGGEEAGRDLGASIGYMFLIGALSFLLWYRPIYNGYMKDHWRPKVCPSPSPREKIVLIAPLSTGAAGLIRTIQMFVKHYWAAAVLGLVATVGWIIQGLGNAYYYREIYNHHTAAGHTMEKAKAELATHGAKAYFTRG
ncbi:hypothetical protein C0991_003879 [Blastosporella zonata]|nr:hypothetical protein C0991_003879 [Blastosporella zonata]